MPTIATATNSMRRNSARTRSGLVDLIDDLDHGQHDGKGDPEHPEDDATSIAGSIMASASATRCFASEE